MKSVGQGPNSNVAEMPGSSPERKWDLKQGTKNKA